MIVVDSSALMAILFHEPERQTFKDICACLGMTYRQLAVVLTPKMGTSSSPATMENDDRKTAH